MATSHFVRNLHIATLLSSAFAFALVLAVCIAFKQHHVRWWLAGDAWLRFAYIPLCISIASSAAYLRLHVFAKPGAWRPYPFVWAALHAALFAGYMTSLIVTWIRDPTQLEYEARLAMLEAYATVPLMLNMMINLTIVLSTLSPSLASIRAWLASGAAGKTCPNCHCRVDAQVKPHKEGNQDGYSLLRGEDYDDDAARPSEETAVGTIVDV